MHDRMTRLTADLALERIEAGVYEDPGILGVALDPMITQAQAEIAKETTTGHGPEKGHDDGKLTYL